MPGAAIIAARATPAPPSTAIGTVPITEPMPVMLWPSSFGLDGTAIGLVIWFPVIGMDLWRVVARHQGPLEVVLATPAGQIRVEDPQRLSDVDLIDGVLPGGWRGLTIVESMF